MMKDRRQYLRLAFSQLLCRERDHRIIQFRLYWIHRQTDILRLSLEINGRCSPIPSIFVAPLSPCIPCHLYPFRSLNHVKHPIWELEIVDRLGISAKSCPFDLMSSESENFACSFCKTPFFEVSSGLYASERGLYPNFNLAAELTRTLLRLW